MFTVTFYSYKGGVGRTMALINIAYRLSAKGKRVFVLDFDLEAPGIDSFFEDSRRDCPGIVEYVTEYLETRVVPDLSAFVTEVRSAHGGTGPIYFMGAGRRDSEYQRSLARLNWKEFYSLSHGFLFVENLKGAIDAKYSPDYVLVDSRTGLTDVAGICTLQLPNVVVFLFALNNQNISGTAKIYSSVVANKLNRAINTLLVATPVPDAPNFGGLKEQRLAKAAETIGRAVDLTLPYAPFAAFRETVLPRDSGTFLGEMYDRFADKIISLNEFDVLTLLKAAKRLKAEGDPDGATAKYAEILETYPTNAEVWRQYGVFLRGVRDFVGALSAFRRALELGGSATNLAELALTHLGLDEASAAEKYFRGFLARTENAKQIMAVTGLIADRGQAAIAIAGYTRVLELVGDTLEAVDALSELGNLYMREHRPADAVPLYEKASTIQPASLSSVYNLGYALHLLGKQEEARTSLGRAIEMCERIGPQRVSPSKRANIEQAIGQGYLILGDASKAKDHFVAALGIAEGLTMSRVYSSVRYEHVSLNEFREETIELLQRTEQQLTAATRLS